jgi:EAL domain-containing protein (putative c-di-GMP-specific phosphodiesterase class I)
MNRRAREQLRLENLLYRAVERGELYVEYQPRVALHSGRIAAMEALLRWRQPELGIVSPDIFIPLAEHTGLIASIGEWVLRTACRQAKAWHEAGHPAVAISVNLSPAQLRLADIAERILAIVAEVGIQPSMLVLEITESVIVHQIERTAELLAGLRSAGLRISIDDFGTGQSSLAYLKRFPADELKIDKTFLDDLPDSAEDAAIYSAIVTLAQRLGLQVVAEGVETDAQLRFLQRLQCNEAQGYLLSRPLPAESARELLDKFTTIRRQIWSSGRAREPAPGAAGAEVISILNELPARTAGLR